MATSVEEIHPFEGLMSELPGGMSRKVVTAQANAANPILMPGTIMAEITGGNSTIHDDAETDGSEALAYGTAGVLLTRVTSLTGELAVIVYHDAVFNINHISVAAGMDAAAQTTALATLRDTADIQIDAR